MSGDRPASSEWTKYVLTAASTIGLLITLHLNFVVPSLRGDMRVIAEEIVGRRLDQWEALRKEQIAEIQKSIDRMADRMDRIDRTVSSELQSISIQITALTQKIQEK